MEQQISPVYNTRCCITVTNQVYQVLLSLKMQNALNLLGVIFINFMKMGEFGKQFVKRKNVKYWKENL